MRSISQSRIFKLSLCSLVFLSCQANVNQSLETGLEKATTGKQEVFSQNREFVYQVSRFEGKEPRVVDTVMLTSKGTVWRSDSTQKQIGWRSKITGTKSGTGVKETSDRVWIHPPRFDEYSILELSPFPEIKLPFKLGQEWDWELAVGSHWSNPAWAVWKGEMAVRTHYKSISNQLVTTPLGQLTCHKVTAIASCTSGSASLALLFHPQYGFVELDYVNIDGKRMRFQLLSVGITDEFNGASYFGRQ
jgi:hypothetical protein